MPGYARLVGTGRIEVDGVPYSAPSIVVATGGQPLLQRLPGAELGIICDRGIGICFQLRDGDRGRNLLSGAAGGAQPSGPETAPRACPP